MKRYVLPCLLFVSVLMSCNQGNAPVSTNQNNAPGLTDGQTALRRVFAAQQAEFNLKSTDDFEVIDGITGETYSSQRGFGKVEMAKVSPDGGKATLPDGTVLPLSADQGATGLSAQSVFEKWVRGWDAKRYETTSVYQRPDP